MNWQLRKKYVYLHNKPIINRDMKKILLGLTAALTMTGVADTFAQEYSRTYKPFDKVVFYDGYNETVFDAGLEDGILRHRNSLYAKKLTNENMDWFALETRIKVTIDALCDNYDRIGNINLALVPKGSETYDAFEVQRIELARFITPFMNKNAHPTAVSYEYDTSLVGYIMHDMNIRDNYDVWMEFELFGIPYAANTQVKGCEGRNDVFSGTVEFTCSDEPAENNYNTVTLPIVMKKPEYKSHNMNNYSELGTDTIGTTTKTYKFTVPAKLSDAQLVLVMSNHGANAGGEEYEPRLHLLYHNDNLITTFTPGGKSCEPYRYLNTQGNGIYGSNPKNDRVWIANSNWCPGDAIPIRTIVMGEMEAGEHEIMIRVPEAVFADQQGDFPVSMYLQGLKEGNLPVEVEEIPAEQFGINAYQKGNDVYATSEYPINQVSIYTYDGKFVYGSHDFNKAVSLEHFAPGIYLVNFFNSNGEAITIKAIRN